MCKYSVNKIIRSNTVTPSHVIHQFGVNSSFFTLSTKNQIFALGPISKSKWIKILLCEPWLNPISVGVLDSVAPKGGLKASKAPKISKKELFLTLCCKRVFVTEMK